MAAKIGEVTSEMTTDVSKTGHEGFTKSRLFRQE